MSDETDRPASSVDDPNEALLLLVREQEQEARRQSSLRAALESGFFEASLSAVIGQEEARALTASRFQTDEVFHSLSRLMRLRSAKRSELTQLLRERETYDQSPIPDSGMTLSTEPTHPGPLPEWSWSDALEMLARQGRERNALQIKSTSKLLLSVENAISKLGGSSLSQQATAICEDHEHDGFVTNSRARAKGYVLQRRNEAIADAFELTLHVVTAVYDDPSLRPLSDAVFSAELVARLDAGAFPGFGKKGLGLCADTIEHARIRCGKDQRSSRTTEQDTVRLVKQLRHSQMEEMLRPRTDLSDGRGSGEKSATWELLSRLTGLGFSTIKACCSAGKNSRAKSKRRRGRQHLRPVEVTRPDRL